MITGYEISADDSKVHKLPPQNLRSIPLGRKEEIVAALKNRLAQIEELRNSKLSLNMDAPRDLFYDPMRQIYDKARHDKFVKDKTNEELEALNTAATNYDSLLKIAKQAITLACWQVRNKRDNAPNWVINRLTKHLNDAERAIAVERAQMTYEIIKNRYGEIPNPSAENAITAEEVKENYKRVAVAQAKIRYARMQESFNEYYEKARVTFQRPDNKDVVYEYFNQICGIAKSKELGDVILDRHSVKSSIGHGIGSKKAAAFMAVKEVIENGKIFSREINWKNRGYDSAAIVAPINIGEKEYICEVIIKQEKTQNSFYLHEVQLKEKVAGAFKTSTGEVAPATEPSLFKSILVENYFNVKNNVSKIIDKNGEPLVVYHGTNAKFNVFEYGDIGFHFGTKESAKSRGETVGEYFLNIKNTPSTVY